MFVLKIFTDWMFEYQRSLTLQYEHRQTIKQKTSLLNVWRQYVSLYLHIIYLLTEQVGDCDGDGGEGAGHQAPGLHPLVPQRHQVVVVLRPPRHQGGARGSCNQNNCRYVDTLAACCWITVRASNEGSRRFHNHGEAPSMPPDPYDLCVCHPISLLLTLGSLPV